MRSRAYRLRQGRVKVVDRRLTGEYAGGPGWNVSFAPRKLLLTYDGAGGACWRVVPRMQRMLEDRAFVVTVVELAQAPASLSDFDGVVLGTPVGLRAGGPTPAVLDWVGRAEGLDEKRVALFSVFWVREGAALATLRNRLGELGAEVVVDYAYWALRPSEGEHLLPAECMVRIR